MTTVLFNLAAGRGNTREGRIWFGVGAVVLGAYVLLSAALPFVHASELWKESQRAHAGIAAALVVLSAVVIQFTRPLWSHLPSLRARRS